MYVVAFVSESVKMLPLSDESSAYIWQHYPLSHLVGWYNNIIGNDWLFMFLFIIIFLH